MSFFPDEGCIRIDRGFWTWAAGDANMKINGIDKED